MKVTTLNKGESKLQESTDTEKEAAVKPANKPPFENQDTIERSVTCSTKCLSATEKRLKNRTKEDQLNNDTNFYQ